FQMHKLSLRARVLTGVAAAISAMALGVVAAQPAAATTGNPVGFGFVAPQVAGFPTGAVFLAGGGAYNPSTGFVHAGGRFNCTASVNQGPLAGCQEHQGVRWDTDHLLSSTPFKCTANDTLKTATTGDDTVVVQADFYRAGDGNHESFSAQMIVSEHDLAP